MPRSNVGRSRTGLILAVKTWLAMWQSWRFRMKLLCRAMKGCCIWPLRTRELTSQACISIHGHSIMAWWNEILYIKKKIIYIYIHIYIYISQSKFCLCCFSILYIHFGFRNSRWPGAMICYMSGFWGAVCPSVRWQRLIPVELREHNQSVVHSGVYHSCWPRNCNNHVSYIEYIHWTIWKCIGSGSQVVVCIWNWASLQQLHIVHIERSQVEL